MSMDKLQFAAAGNFELFRRLRFFDAYRNVAQNLLVQIVP